MNYRQRQPINRKAIIALIIAAVVVAAALVALKIHDNKDTTGAEKDRSEKIYDIAGIDCYKRQNIETYLFMGIDEYKDKEGVIAESVQNDTNILLIIDRAKKTYTMLHIDRNAMVEIPINTGGNTDDESGVLQLALAYALGDLGEGSCEKAEKAVSNLLYNQRIDGYMSLTMDSIRVINHLLGGVTVTVEDDFSKVDPTLVKGETIKLSDEQAEHFVRGRKGVENGDNTNRMARQRQFMDAATDLFITRFKEDNSFLDEAVEELEPYMVTNMNGQVYSKLAKSVSSDTKNPEPEIKSTTTVSEYTGWAETEYDTNSLAKAVIELFYEPLHPNEVEVLLGDDSDSGSENDAESDN